MSSHDWDDDLEPGLKLGEKFEDRGHRLARKPPRRRSVKALLSENQEHYNPLDNVKFDDPGLQDLFERTLITDLLWELKSGKEATVYVCSSSHANNGLAAAKLYIDSRVRGFKDDAMYRQGRFIPDQRLQKAMDQGSRNGIDARNMLWVSEEFRQMQALQTAGVRVPRPLARSEVGTVLLMEFIGDDDGAAPRVSEAKLSKDEAFDAFRQAVQQYGLILASGRVHGDYSTFNLLYWQGEVIVIDFPQVVMMNANPAAASILERDVNGLCRTFRALGVKADPNTVLADVKRIARMNMQRMATEQQLAVL